MTHSATPERPHPDGTTKRARSVVVLGGGRAAPTLPTRAEALAMAMAMRR